MKNYIYGIFYNVPRDGRVCLEFIIIYCTNCVKRIIFHKITSVSN